MTKKIHTCILLAVMFAAGTLGASLGSSIADVDASSGKTPLIEMTKALLREQSRASSTSEVLTLNLTNLVILVVIKAIIFGFGFFGAGAGRSADGAREAAFAEADLMMMMSYALGSSTDDYSCLYRIACDEPNKAHEYMTASKMLLKGAKIFKNVVGYNPKYEDVVYGIQEAIEYRNNGGKCSKQYICKPMPSL